MIIAWPKVIGHGGEIRTQYGHVIDILPTTLELLHLSAPEEIRSVRQQPIQGTSLAYALNDASAPSQHKVQYYYIFGSRAIYEDGWKASLAYPNDFLGDNGPDAGKTFDENAWELYDMNTDYTERLDLAKQHPDKLAHLRALFEQQAKDHNLYPLITWDDVKNGRIHRNKDSKSLKEEFESITHRSDEK